MCCILVHRTGFQSPAVASFSYCMAISLDFCDFLSLGLPSGLVCCWKICANLISLKEWTGDPTKSSESIQNQPVKNDLPFRATQPKPSTPFPKWQRPMATTGPVKYRPGKYTPTKYLPARYSPARYYPARYAAAKTFVPRKPRQTPVQVQGSYIKESNRFVLNQDNAGKDAWRQRRQPDGLFSFDNGRV